MKWCNRDMGKPTKQKTPKGQDIPIPTRKAFIDNLKKTPAPAETGEVSASPPASDLSETSVAHSPTASGMVLTADRFRGLMTAEDVEALLTTKISLKAEFRDLNHMAGRADLSQVENMDSFHSLTIQRLLLLRYSGRSIFEPASLAARLGLRPGLVLQRADGKTVEEVSDKNQDVETQTPGGLHANRAWDRHAPPLKDSGPGLTASRLPRVLSSPSGRRESGRREWCDCPS